MKNLLHVGCGVLNIKSLPSYFQDGGWAEVRVDIDLNVRPDIVAEIQDLSIIESSTIEAIYSSHNIEHVWEHEVPIVLKEFHRVLVRFGFAVILCPDILSVSQAIVNDDIDTLLYESGAGPIRPIDVLYGHGAAIASGRHYMAHKTAFTATSLARHILDAGFSRAYIVRDKYFGLHAVAFKESSDLNESEVIAAALMPSSAEIIEAKSYLA